MFRNKKNEGDEEYKEGYKLSRHGSAHERALAYFLNWNDPSAPFGKGMREGKNDKYKYDGWTLKSKNNKQRKRNKTEFNSDSYSSDDSKIGLFSILRNPFVILYLLYCLIYSIYWKKINYEPGVIYVILAGIAAPGVFFIGVLLTIVCIPILIAGFLLQYFFY